MKVVVRCIYFKPVTPSIDIIDMDDAVVPLVFIY